MVGGERDGGHKERDRRRRPVESHDLALALQQRGMRAVIYEKDANFDSRSQGYGLTIQQARCISPCRAFDSHILTFCAGCDSAQAACHRRYGG